MKRTFVMIAVLMFTAFNVKADSPITSTYFAGSYFDYSIVLQAESAREVNDAIAEYLLDEDNPIDVKAAIINAIGWSLDGSSNSEKFKSYIAKKRGITTAQINLDDLSGDELFCLGYFLAYDDYFIVDESLNILAKAVAKNQTSFTVNMIYTLVKAQKAMDTDFCKVWKLTADLLNNKSLKRDMKTSAIQMVVDYMILYKQDCYYAE
jgi:hypothetical protein